MALAQVAAKKLQQYDDHRSSFDDWRDEWAEPPAVVVKKDNGMVKVKSPVLMHSDRYYVRGAYWGYGGAFGGERLA